MILPAHLVIVGVLQEDSSVTEKRAAVRLLYDKIKMAIDDVQYKQEKVKRKDHEGDNVSPPAALRGPCAPCVFMCACCGAVDSRHACTATVSAAGLSLQQISSP